MPKSKSKAEWFIMKCDFDNSYSLVPKRDVIHVGSVKPGDTLKFRFPDASGRTKTFDGVVQALGTSDEYSSLLKKQDELNKGNKKSASTSFDAEKPRKSAVTATLKIKSNVGRHKKVSPASDKVLVSSKRGVKKIVDSDDENTEECQDNPCGPFIDLSDSDDSDLSFEEQQLLLRAQEKQKKREAKKLKEIGDSLPGVSLPSSSASEGPASRELVSDVSDKQDMTFDFDQQDRFARNSSDHELNDGFEGTANKLDDLDKDFLNEERNADSSREKKLDVKSGDNRVPSDAPGETGHRKRKPEVPATFSGEMYLHAKDDPNVVELYAGAGVYLNAKEFSNIKSSASSAGSLARQLMKAVFTVEALSTCSLGGNLAFGKGKPKEEVRPGLDSHGVDAVFNYTKMRQRKKVEYKNWKEQDDSTIKTRMRNVLCEHRMHRAKISRSENKEQ